MTPAEVLVSLFDELEGEYWPSYRAEERARVTAHLAQLELIAGLARKACSTGVLVSKHWDSPGTDASVQKVLDALWVLDMALVDLDHHPDTRP